MSRRATTPLPVTTAVEPARFERVARCPLCDGTKIAVWRRRCRDRLHAQVDARLSYARCRRCAAVFLATRLAETDVPILYDDDYAPYGHDATSGRRAPRSRL